MDMKKTAVVIDFFGTLTPSMPGSVWTEHAALSAAPLGIPAASWRAALDGSFAERATGLLGDLPATFRTLAERCGASPSEEQIAQACEARRAAQGSLFVCRGDAIGSLAGLRARGLRLALLSDCSLELPEAWPQLPVAEYFDTAVFSCLAGFRKPDPRLFEMVTTQLGVAPEECLYIGDGGGRELTGATKAGMKALMLRAPDWYLDDPHSREDDWDGEEVASFTELLARPEISAS
jgi:putative hydrolase of the HAD superfamily